MASSAAGTSEDDPRERGMVRRTTAEFLRSHVAQPNGLSQAIFREEVGFVTEDQNRELELERREIWSEALKEAQQLAIVIADTQKKLCKHDPSFRPLNPQEFTLPQLMKALESNQHRYETEDLKGSKGFLRRGFRKIGENAESFKLWLELVPRESLYTSPIVGGFIIFFSLAEKMHKVREDVFQMMTAVPEDFNNLKDYLAVYEEVNDRKLQICAANVTTSIFKTLQQAMRFMGENPFKKTLKVVLKADRYEEVIDQNLTRLKESKLDFRNQIDKCLHTRVGSLFRLAKSSSMLQQMMIYEFLQFKDDAINAINSGSQDLKYELQDLRNVIMNAMYNKLLTDQDDRNYLAESAARKMLEMEKKEQKRIRNSMGVSELASLLEYDSKDPQMDVLQALRDGVELSEDDICRLNWIKKSSRLRSWLIDDVSDSLMIEANIDTSPAAYTSALSFLCAEMAHLFEAIQKTIVVSHFCGLAALPSSKRDAGPEAMMVSFIGQLLEMLSDDASPDVRVEKETCQGVGIGQLDSLCDAFEKLVLQLPKPWTVICIIDTINFYEIPARLNGTLDAIKHLRKLAHKCKKHDVVFKLLVTEPKRSLYVAREFTDQHRLIAPEDPLESGIVEPHLEDIVSSDY